MPIPRGDAEAGPAGPPTRLPELLARTPDVARASTLLGAEVIDPGLHGVAVLEDLVARSDGRVVALVTRPDGRLVGVPLSDLLARAKPDMASGSEHVTIRSFKLTRTGRRLDAAPVVEDDAQRRDGWFAPDGAWLAKLDAGAPEESPAPVADGDRPASVLETGDAQPAPPAPDAGKAQPAAPAPDAGEAQPAPPAPHAGDARPAVSAEAPMPRLGALTGRVVLDPDGRPIGTIADVVLDVPKARVAYLMVLPRQAVDGAEPFRAVPFEALGPGGDEDGVRLTMDARALAKSPAFRAQDLPVDPFAAPAGAATEPEPR